ncbi:MAG: hypothetical protein GX607_01515 [Myxococcales bacterium]|jgi:hypothetical protein|nr:hypothetical protein [Myxococcales bacterium]
MSGRAQGNIEERHLRRRRTLRDLTLRLTPLFAVAALAGASCTAALSDSPDDEPMASSSGGATSGTGGGAPVIECPRGLDPCGTSCVDLQTSVAHCGDCDAPCATGELCSNGTCGSECAAPYEECDGACVDTRNDAAHCGKCDDACSAGTPCFGGDCGCPDDTTICAGQCADLSSDPDHCGACDSPCADDELCVSGSCVPAGAGCPLTDCSGTCVDTQNSVAHCGACGQQCAAGQRCSEGECECLDPDKVRCGSRCVDLQADVAHCGECDNACTGGYPCTEGACACPEGQTLCQGTCVDTESSVLHCGECDNACPGEETCVTGRCSGDVGDDCTNVLAADITIREIAVLQAGKVSIMNGGEEVESRAADVIAGKNGVLRVYTDTSASFSPRVLSARLSLLNGEELEQVFHKRTVSASSSEANLASTFNIEVPGELITSSTSYVVEIVECGDSPAGTPLAPKYPTDGAAPLAARDVGRLKLVYVPLNAPNGVTPNVAPERLELYSSYLASMFPVAGVDHSLGAPLAISGDLQAEGTGWTEALVELRDRHATDNAANDVYYYGLFEPSASNYCNRGCVAGMGYVPEAGNNARHYRVAIGLSRGSRGDAETMAHEIGHTHGRPHSPCGGPDSPDPNYPHGGGQIGWWGFEATNTLHAPDRTDIMGYCRDQWVSDYVYRLLTERVATINGGTGFRSADLPIATWRSAVTDARGPRWVTSFSKPAQATGTPERAEILDAAGNPLLEVTVYRIPMDHLGAAELMVPEPEPGWHSILFRGQQAPLRFDAGTMSLP